MNKPATLFAAIIFTLVALAHLLRVLLGLSITIGGWPVPLWMSVIGFIVPCILVVALMQERKR